MANNDGGQGWIVANIPYDLISVIGVRLSNGRYAQYCTTVPSPPAEIGWKPELASQLATASAAVRTGIITAEAPSHTSTSPRLENGWVTVGRSGVETIRLKSRNSPGRKGLDLSLLESRSSGSGERAKRDKERQGSGQ